MRPNGSQAELERRRIRAVELVEQGEPVSLVARILGVQASSIHRWRQMVQQEGGLSAKPIPGRPPRLSEPQRQELEKLLLEGATKHGWANNLWTCARVGKVIEKAFGVSYNTGYVSRILQRLNWSPQKPKYQHTDRDDAAIADWVKNKFPRIVEEARRRNAYLAFVDESGFMLNPTVRRTWAPRGKTPVNKVASAHDRISVIGAITVAPDGKRFGLHYHMLANNVNFQGPAVAFFIRKLHLALAGPVTIFWDQITIHSCDGVEQYIEGAPEVVVEPFPPYASEFNPADGIWGYVKYGRLPNYTPPDLDVLRVAVTGELDQLRHEEGLLRSFIRHTKLPLDL